MKTGPISLRLHLPYIFGYVHLFAKSAISKLPFAIIRSTIEEGARKRKGFCGRVKADLLWGKWLVCLGCGLMITG